MLNVQKGSSEEGETAIGCAAFVKVSMDGAPYLRKVGLKTYKSYKELSDALGKMFSSFTIGKQFNYLLNFRNENFSSYFSTSHWRLRVMADLVY